jgi:hypothetical protein
VSGTRPLPENFISNRCAKYDGPQTPRSRRYGCTQNRGLIGAGAGAKQTRHAFKIIVGTIGIGQEPYGND